MTKYCTYLAFIGFFISIVGAFTSNDSIWIFGVLLILMAIAWLFLETPPFTLNNDVNVSNDGGEE